MSRLQRWCALSGVLATFVLVGSAQAKHPFGPYHRSVCAKVTAGQAHCLSFEDTTPNGKPFASSTPPAGSYGPADLRSAYNLQASGSSGETVAIVDAYNEPNLLKTDLPHYRSYYGLPAINVSGGPTFKVVNQTGGTSLPSTDSGWGDEEALDVEMVSAICPNCSILLVEAKSPSTTNLITAEKTAQGAANVVAVSNSWGASETSSETSYDTQGSFGNHATTVSAGDSGYGAEWPATSSKVTAVGGTSLTRSGSSWSESVWSSGGSGCSAYEPQPAWQAFLDSAPYTGCSHRAEADVSAIGDPSTGVAVYDSCGDAWSYYFSPAPCAGSSGWQVFGGTSVGSPIIASVFALAGGGTPATPYQNDTASNFRDVRAGSNGTCSPSWLCTAEAGYDGPTGLGSPQGLGGF